MRFFSPLGAIFFTIALDLLGFGLVMPFLAEEVRDTFGATELTCTLLGSVYSLMQFLFVPVWGRLSDYAGRRPVLLWSILATTLSNAWLGLSLTYSQSVLWLFIARAFAGMATANLGTASAYIADVTSPEERARGMGLIGAAFGIGFTLGPMIGGVLAPIEIRGRHGAIPCLIAAGLSGINALWVAFGLTESLPQHKRAPFRIQSLFPLNYKAASHSFSVPGVSSAIITNFILLVAFTNLDQTFRFFNKDVFGMSSSETGIVFAYMGILSAIIQGGLIRFLSKRMEETFLIRIGVALQACGFAGMVIAPSTGKKCIFIACTFLVMGNAATQPSISSFISKRADVSSQGSILGTNQAIGSLARMIGPAIGGYTYGSIGPRAPFVAGTLGMVVAFLFAALLRSPPSLQKTSTPIS
ncbi:MFS transporter [Pajaroellobacter abortibovis]|uniref:Major facilitator superfamily (MFS) profile domain-containing protein n=1 Tax=Pajaroellobacter abortibovis TaxID=1882918 RepID=A0A1L6MUR5_9BACT|nr:MFS transporter [Pajaroellobacter abortibovis]APR99253.1 hypothetical protein BCY86_00120 [Pajaroellobacter abortibovis]